MSGLPRLFLALFLLSSLLIARQGRAEPYSAYERETISLVLKDLANGKPAAPSFEASPEGKTIERIDIVRLEVFEKRDPAPGFLNVLHTLTKESIVGREVLLRAGEPYRQDLADETARNLRRLPQLSLVMVVPLRGSTPDRMRLLVITKDVWSLRMGFDIGLSSSGLESLLLEPTESNLAGSHQLVLGRFTYRPNAYSLGMAYRIPRVQGLWLALNTDANVIVNRTRGNPEGSFGIVSASRFLYSKYAEWAWSSQLAWRDEVSRRYVGVNVARFNAEATPESDAMPYQFRSRRYTSTHSLTRSFGRDIKNDFTIGAEMNLRRYRTAFDADLPEGAAVPNYNPVAVAEFERRVMPRSDTRVGPFLQWHGYTTNFLRVHDFESLALQEDYRLGHDLWLRVYPVAHAFGSSRSFLGVYGAAQYTLQLGSDGLVRGSVEATNEFESDRMSDASLELDLRVSTPRFGFGRLVFDAALLNRYRNYLNRTSFLGGDGRLRGYPSGYFAGKDVLVGNVEFRTLPLAIFSVQLSGAAFYDVGNAVNGLDKVFTRDAVRLHHSAGVGFRVLFPQVDRIVFRGDLGFPLDRPAGVNGVTFFFTFQQAFGLSTVGTLAGQGTSATSGMLGQ
ncbi:hypothetical protein [Pendulispora albinea]|uniref:Bacterial surface antigen (D15) domain-containing protein n=1 Tax=Pendulispora albinea TaxID=2741071 RepID=A0ABZ2M8Q2_9BACT